MSQWPDVARVFSGALLDPQAPRPAFVSNDDRRFNVYRNNVTLGLIRALEANFPALVTLLGADFFRAMARDFVASHPPTSRLLFEYGAELGDFIAKAENLAAYPYLSDVARLEHAWLESFHEADSPPLAGADLQQAFAVQGGSLSLIIHPATRLLQSHFAALDIAEASRHGDGLAGVVLDSPQSVLLTRPQMQVIATALTHGEFAFLSKLATKATFEHAAEAGFDADSDFDLDGAMVTMLAQGVCTAVRN
jgi:hypothetical protein